MARARTPDGKRVVIPVRVSEPKADAIDKARGDVPRSVWVERAIDAALAGPSGERPPGRAPKPAAVPSPKPKAGPAGQVESASDIAAFFSRRANGGQQ